jgi:uncharacterized membrane protein
MHILDIATIVITGLMIGNELTVSLFINPVMRQLDAAAQARSLSLFAGLLGRVMPFWYAVCLALLIAETILRRSEIAFLPLIAASTLWAIIILFTVLVLVPINNRIAALNTDAEFSQWIGQHNRWEKLHRLRIVLLIVAMILLTHALLPA